MGIDERDRLRKEPLIGFGRRNVHCSNCGDERGGPFGHEIGECLYRKGMTAAELAATMPEEKAVRYWEMVVDAYFERELGDVSDADSTAVGGQPNTRPLDVDGTADRPEVR